MKVGYVRVSTIQQNTDRQEVMMDSLNVEKIFMDKLSGKDQNRPELLNMLSFVREGDVVIVESISRLARSTRDFLSIVDQFTEKKVEFISIKENLDTATPQGRFMLTVFAALAELERENTLLRQREGIAIAKEKGKYKGRQPKSLPTLPEIYEKWKMGKITATEAAESLGVSRSSFYRISKEYEEGKRIVMKRSGTEE